MDEWLFWVLMCIPVLMFIVIVGLAILYCCKGEDPKE